MHRTKKRCFKKNHQIISHRLNTLFPGVCMCAVFKIDRQPALTCMPLHTVVICGLLSVKLPPMEKRSPIQSEPVKEFPFCILTANSYQGHLYSYKYRRQKFHIILQFLLTHMNYYYIRTMILKRDPPNSHFIPGLIFCQVLLCRK